MRYFMIGIIRYCKSIGQLNNVNFKLYSVDGKILEDGGYVSIFKIMELRKDCEYDIEEGYEPDERFKIYFSMYFEDFAKKEIISDKCVICLAAPSSMHITACGHTCICKECENMMEVKPIKCPLCREINRIVINKND